MSDPVPDSDHQLLARYARDHAEAAFAELVRRHVNLVHSAALRQVRSPQLAEEVAQSVFTDLARNAAKLTTAPDPTPVLTAWLYQVTRRTAIDVVRREVRRQLREQIATDLNAMNATAADWTHIEPQLDEAMAALDETDRTAILLRYFENKSLREVGITLGTSDDAAQKRVSRAVERLREFFAKRGVSVGASGLAVVISANAVQAAPVGLALTISTAAVLTGTTLATTATVTATKAIAMTALQKTIVTATIAVLAGAGIYEARQAWQLRDQVQTLQQQQVPLSEQVQKLQREGESAAQQIAALREDNERLIRNTAELLKLRGTVGLLQEMFRKESDNVVALQKTIRQIETERLQFKGQFIKRSEFSDRGSEYPLDTVQTMLWAMKEGDETKLGQLIAPTTNTFESLTRLPKRNWSQIAAIQIVEPSEDKTLSRPGSDQETAFVKAIVERQWSPPILEGKIVTDQTLIVWDFIRTNGQWLISERP